MSKGKTAANKHAMLERLDDIAPAKIVGARQHQPTIKAGLDELLGPDELKQGVRARLQGTDQPYLNTSLVPEIPIALPPVSEQQCIVAEANRRLSLLRETEAQVDANLQRDERLRQSVLSKAFSTLPITK